MQARQLPGHGVAVGHDAQCQCVGLPRQQQVDQAEVLECGAVVGPVAQRGLQCGERLGVFAPLHMQRRDVVVGLGEVGVVFGQGPPLRHRLGAASGLGQQRALEETHARITWLAGQVPLGALQRQREVTGTAKPFDLGQCIGRTHRRSATQEDDRQQCAQQEIGWVHRRL